MAGQIRESWMKCTMPKERIKAFEALFKGRVDITNQGEVDVHGQGFLTQDQIDDALDLIDLGMTA